MEQQGKPIQWFPGHMARTRRKIEESLPLVDAVAELVDARIPLSSRNPDLGTITADKPRLVVLNKADLADPAATKAWIAWFAGQGLPAMAVDAKSGQGLQAFVPALRRLLAERIAAWTAKGMGGRPLRVMIVGIPNVGKSSLINRLTRSGKAKTEDRHGVTRHNQWFVIGEGAQLLDTPGVLWPKFEDPEAARRLAFTGAIRDVILDGEELACYLLKLLAREYPAALLERYKLPAEALQAVQEDEMDPLNPLGASYELLEAVGRRRGMRIAGGEVDTGRAAAMLLDEYRAGKLGKLTLDHLPAHEGKGE